MVADGDDSRLFSTLPVRRVSERQFDPMPREQWPATIPAVRQLLNEGLDLAAVTILVGENGAGKSTLVEGIAIAFGLSPEGGSTGAAHVTRPSESPLAQYLWLDRGPGAGRWGYFLRNETMHSLFTYLENNRSVHTRDPDFHTLSHGESFLEMLGTRRFTGGGGFFVFDEPEAGLSFSSCLQVVGAIAAIARAGGQVLVATHSPVIASMPEALVLEVNDDGWSPVSWEELAMVAHYRSFLQEPMRYLRHVL